MRWDEGVSALRSVERTRCLASYQVPRRVERIGRQCPQTGLVRTAGPTPTRLTPRLRSGLGSFVTPSFPRPVVPCTDARDSGRLGLQRPLRMSRPAGTDGQCKAGGLPRHGTSSRWFETPLLCERLRADTLSYRSHRTDVPNLLAERGNSSRRILLRDRLRW